MGNTPRKHLAQDTRTRVCMSAHTHQRTRICFAIQKCARKLHAEPQISVHKGRNVNNHYAHKW